MAPAVKSGVFRYDGSALTISKMLDYADGCLPVGLDSLNSSAERGIPQNLPNRLKFYNRKSMAKRALKMMSTFLQESGCW
jgi:hypothetical protein